MNRLFIGSVEIPVKHSVFPGGEVYTKIDAYEDNRFNRFTIKSNIRTSNDVISLLMLTDAVRRKFAYDVEIVLELPYLPYARQDRVCAEGESLSIKVFCDLINSQNYTQVVVWDVHSDVGLALLNNVQHIEQHYFVSKVVDDLIGGGVNPLLVSPDQGAYKKVQSLSDRTGVAIGVVGSKTRIQQNITLEVSNIALSVTSNEDLLVVDDICDGGRTFIELAKELRKLTTGDLYLYTTHGIYSNGLQPLTKYYKHFFTANPFADSVNEDLVTIVK